MLKHIAELFAIEKSIRGCSVEVRRPIRHQSGRPLATAFRKWLCTKLGLIGKLADAIRYAPSRWEWTEAHTLKPLTVRPITRNLKNAPFAGSAAAPGTAPPSLR